MACSSGPHLHFFLWTSSVKLRSPIRFTLPNCSSSSRPDRLSASLSLSATPIPPCADITVAETTSNASLTLRELCQGRVPDHVLHRKFRVEEIGYTEPTYVQGEALPVLFSGRHCVTHAQVTKVARTLAAKSPELESEQKSCTILALLDGVTLRRHKSWLKVDFMFNSSKEVSSFKRLLTTYSSINNRQTIYDCMQHKWIKICGKRERQSTLLHLLQSDTPQSAISFVGEQSEKSKKAGNSPPTTLLIEFLKTSYKKCSEIGLLKGDMNFNQQATTLTDVKQAEGYLLVATDIAARGVDLPETTHTTLTFQRML